MCDHQRLRSACVCAQSDQSLCLSLEYSMIVKLLTEHHLEFLSLTGGCRGSSESTLVEMSIVGNLMPNMTSSNKTQKLAHNVKRVHVSVKPHVFQLLRYFYYEYRYIHEPMRFPTMGHFDKCRLRRDWAASF